MIKILDAYIIKQFLKTFFFTAMLFSLIAVVIDFSDRLTPFLENGVTWQQVVFTYYLHFVIHINGLLWPLFALISVIFFSSRLAKNSEIISILNAGVPYLRIMVPYLVAAGIIFTIHLAANHYLIPLGSKIRIPFENKYIWKNTDRSKTRHIHVMVDPNTKLYILNYRQRDSTALDLRLESYDEGGELVKYIEARRAKWNAESNKWTLKDYVVHTFDGMNETVYMQQNQELDTTINITPDDLRRVKNQQQLFTTPELKIYLAKQRARGIGGTRIFETELYRRTSEPVSIFILTLIGMAVSSRKTRGGLGIHLAIGISLGALFIVLTRFTMTFTNSESMGPVIGVWLPNIIFSVVALFMVKMAQQ